jgi:transcriptional regulator with XRE-family HTH domain
MLLNERGVHMTDQDSFGAYLRRLRESKGLSLRQVAKDAGVSSGYLSQIEGEKRGKRKTGEHFAPHPQILKQLAAVYHVPAQDLFERAGFFEKKKDYFGFSEEKETDRCFDLVLHDPVLRKVLTTRDKKAIIDRYETLSGRKFITWGGENSLLNEKSEYKGLQLSRGVLYAETNQATLTLEEVEQELGIGMDSVKTLIEHGHLRTVGPPKGPPVIEKAEIRELKWYAIGEGLKLLLLRDRKHRPQTPKDYEKAAAEIGAKAWEKLEEEIKKKFPSRKKRQGKRAKKKA